MAEPPAASGISMVCQLVLADQKRINRLFAALDGGQQLEGTSRATLSHECSRLARLVNVHMAAEEEICYPVLFGLGDRTIALLKAAIADHGDIHEALAEGELAPVASAAWSRTVAYASAACAQYFARAQQGLLREISANLDAETDRVLAWQWQAFTANQADESPLTGAEAWNLVAGSRLA